MAVVMYVADQVSGMLLYEDLVHDAILMGN